MLAQWGSLQMRAIFISGPITAPTFYQVQQNIRRAETILVKLIKKGWAVHCPHKNSEFLSGALHKHPEEDFERWMAVDLELLGRLDAIFMMKNWRKSRGSKMEHAEAKRLEKDIYYEEKGDLINGHHIRKER